MANLYRGELDKLGDILYAEFAPGVDSRPRVIAELSKLALAAGPEVIIPDTELPFGVVVLIDPDIMDQCEDWGQRTSGLGQRLNSPVEDMGRVTLQAFPNAVLIGFPAETE